MNQKDYWNKNIEGWASYYKQSHSKEEVQGSALVRILYKLCIMPIEAILMKKRYSITLNFLNGYANKERTFVDLGCGVGTFAPAALKGYKEYIAIDFSETALAKVRENLSRMNLPLNYKLQLVDLVSSAGPQGNVKIAMGVLPYIEQDCIFLQRNLPGCDAFMFNFVSRKNFFNILRRLIPTLNVRKLYFHDINTISRCIESLGFTIQRKIPLGTGFIMMVVPTARQVEEKNQIYGS